MHFVLLVFSSPFLLSLDFTGHHSSWFCGSPTYLSISLVKHFFPFNGISYFLKPVTTFFFIFTFDWNKWVNILSKFRFLIHSDIFSGFTKTDWFVSICLYGKVSWPFWFLLFVVHFINDVLSINNWKKFWIVWILWKCLLFNGYSSDSCSLQVVISLHISKLILIFFITFKCTS